MHIVKAEMERQNELRVLADRILREVGYFTQCPHGTLESTGDEAAKGKAYAYATLRWKNGDVDGSQEEMMDAIKASTDDYYGSCCQCERYSGG